MSEEMAVTETSSGEEAKINGDEAAPASATGIAEASVEPSTQTTDDPAEESTSQPTDEAEIKEVDESEAGPRKRRASSAFSDESNSDFRGFDKRNLDDSTVEYNRVLERMEAEVSAASEALVPVRSVVATPTGVSRVSKRLRQDTHTDGSRPSSALSSRSDGEGVSTDLPPPASTFVPVVLASSAASSPANRGARRATTEMSSPLLRVPLERGWRRELVYRAALDSHSRRNADIYYYMPSGKKLRSTREIAENLSGTGLTLENFSFFKEPLGVDDPEKEIIRDAKMIRKSEAAAPAPAPALLEGKRTPKPKPPKGASPEPPTVKSPPAKIRVKSMGSRLSSGGATTPTTQKPPPKKQEKPTTPSTDNNNTTWKKPSDKSSASPGPGAPGGGAPGAAPPPPPRPAPARPPPPPLQSRPDVITSPETHRQPSPLVQQPCSIQCGGGRVPSLACAMCLCLYHPACANHPVDNDPAFLCKNCAKCPPPPLEPPPLTHKPAPRRAEPPASPLTITMKVQGSDAGGQRVWAVKPAGAATGTAVGAATGGAAARALALRPTLPQSLAVFNGRRFIVVPRNLQAPNHDAKSKVKVANGAAPASPRRRTRAKPDDTTDHFTDFYNLSKEKNYNIVTQIFQYLGMRDLAQCARVCRLWRSLVHAPPLWRHVRMKNSHVSDWGGLCAALKRHGTTRLDLRKMLLPQNDDAFWQSFATHIPSVTTLERIELCRCPARAVEAVCKLRGLRSLCALAVRDARLDPWPLAELTQLHELRLKSMTGLSLTRDLSPLAKLSHLQHLSLTSIKELGIWSCEIVGSLKQLVSLELGECTFGARFGAALRGLTRLTRLRLERGTADCAAPALLRALAQLPRLTTMELVNFDVKVGFDDALAECKNIQRLLIIPTYVSQSATTNKQVLSGVLRLKDTLTHLMWGVTIELLRVTELFIDQCDQGGDSKKKDIGECIPVLKPVPGCRLPDELHHVAGPPQVEILPLPTLQRLLSAQLPNTKLKILRIPFHATWRQSLADFQ